MKRRRVVRVIGVVLLVYVLVLLFAPQVIPRTLGAIGYRYLVPLSLKLKWMQQSHHWNAPAAACGAGSTLTLTPEVPEQVWFKSVDPPELVLLHRGNPEPMVQVDEETWEYRSHYAAVTVQVKARVVDGLFRFSMTARSGP